MSERSNKYILVFVFFAAILSLFSTGHFGGDGLANYLTAKSMIEDHDLVIFDKPFGVTQMRYHTPYETNRGTQGREGKYYSSYGMGMPILLIPFVFMGKIVSSFISGMDSEYIMQFFASFANPIAYSFIALLLFIIVKRLGYNDIISFLISIITIFCTINVIYSRTGFTEPALMLCLVLSAYFLLLHIRNSSWIYMFLSSMCFSYAFFIKKYYFIYVVCYLIYSFIYCRGKRKTDLLATVVAFAIPVILFIAAILFFNYIRFGGLLKTEYGTISEVLHRASTGKRYIKGVYYYLFSSGKGYLFFNASLLLALFTIKDFMKKNKLFGTFILSVVLVTLSFWVFKFSRGSLFSWGTRYILITTPFMGIFLAEFLHQAKDKFRRASIIVIAFLGFIVQLPCLFVNSSRWLLFVKEKLAQQEFLINFVPDLSPIKGCWALFISMLHRIFLGESLTYVYNPDYAHVQSIEASLSGYDILDVWWAHVINLHQDLRIFVIASVLLILSLIAFLLFRINLWLKKCSLEQDL